MGWMFGKQKAVSITSKEITEATEEKESAAKKQRLLETEGGNKGAQVQANQGQSVRKVFGN